MIDIHSHILPGLDDGAATMEETRKLLHEAWNQGFRKIIATPHHYPQSIAAGSMVKLQETLHQVRAEAKKINGDFEIYLGQEAYYHDGLLRKFLAGQVVMMAESRYLLVEFSPEETFHQMYDGLKALMMEGALPIIAHIERYECLYKRMDRISELHRLGVYIQVNLSSLEGSLFSQRTRWCRGLVAAGAVHFLATDTHNMELRPPRADRAVKWLEKTMGEHAVVKLLADNPEHILRNEIL